MLHARHAALAIVGTGRDPDRAETALTVSEDIIFASGRPSILLPTFWQSDGAVPETIVVGWNASREAVCDVHAPSLFQLQRSEVDLRAVK